MPWLELEAPEPFRDSPFSIVRDSETGEARLSRDIAEMFHETKTLSGRTIYVDPVAGSDSNAGTQDAPLRSLDLALRSDASRVILAAGVYDTSTDYVIVTDKVVETLGPVTIRASGADISQAVWTQQADGVWSATVAGDIRRVLDNTQLDSDGWPLGLRRYDTVAELAAADEGWARIGGVLYVKREDEPTGGDFGVGLEALFEGRMRSVGASVLLDGDIELRGITAEAWFRDGRRGEVWATDEVVSVYSPGHAFWAQGGWLVVQGALIRSAWGDGLNADAFQNEPSLIVDDRVRVEWAGDRRTYFADEVPNRQHSSAHGGADHISVGGVARHDFGQGVADTSIEDMLSFSWIVDFDVAETTANQIPFQAGVTSLGPNRFMWVDGVQGDESLIDGVLMVDRSQAVHRGVEGSVVSILGGRDFHADTAPAIVAELGTSEAETIMGQSDAINLLDGRGGADRLFGGNQGDVLVGGNGDDILTGLGGDDSISGGSGYDIAVYTGARGGYSTVLATSVSGGREGGTDIITGVETLAFVDGQLTFHRDGIAAQVMRLYDSAFNRIPDAGGFEAQLDALEGGLSLNALAQLFVDSLEFQNIYGTLSDQAFVEQLYRNVLDRDGDAGGIANALSSLSTQGGSMTRGQLLVAFSESEEHKNLTQGTLDQGLWIADDQTLIIARLYDAAWNRLPDEGGLVTWRNALGGGMSLEDIADAFAGAVEFTNTYGSLTDREFVEQIYRNVLDREGDEGGIQNALNAIAGGASRGDIMLAFSESAEHIGLTRPLWIGGVSLYGTTAAPVEVKDADEPQTLPGVDDFVPLDISVDDEAVVLPGVVDGLAWAKEADVALVLPGLNDGSPLVTPDLAQPIDLLPEDAFHGLRNEGWMH